jgi:hypothetical protein
MDAKTADVCQRALQAYVSRCTFIVEVDLVTAQLTIADHDREALQKKQWHFHNGLRAKM